MAVVGAWPLKSNSTAAVYNNGTDTSMTYNGSNGIFSGSGYVEVSDSSNIVQTKGAMSVEVVFKCTASGGMMIAANWESGCWIIKQNASNNLETLVRTGSIVTNSTSKATNDSKWHHAAIDYTGANHVTYFDGYPVTTTAQTGNTAYLGTPGYIQFGANRQAGPSYTEKLTGGVSNVVIHDQTRSAAYWKNRSAYFKGLF